MVARYEGAAPPSRAEKRGGVHSSDRSTTVSFSAASRSAHTVRTCRPSANTGIGSAHLASTRGGSGSAEITAAALLEGAVDGSDLEALLVQPTPSAWSNAKRADVLPAYFKWMTKRSARKAAGKL